MTISQVLEAIKDWPLDDKVALVEQISDQIAEAAEQPIISEELKALLDQRIAEHEANPEAGRPWEEVKAEILARIRR